MKTYKISKLGGEITFSYSVNTSDTISWQTTETQQGWFTLSTINGVISVSCGEAYGENDKSIIVTLLVNSQQCASIEVAQDALDVNCDCNAMSLDKAEDYYETNPIEYSGDSFEYNYSFVTCNGNKVVSFEKTLPSADYFSLSHDTILKKLTVTVQDAGSRTGTDLLGSITYKVNDVVCGYITFEQEPSPLPPCDCEDITFEMQ